MSKWPWPDINESRRRILARLLREYLICIDKIEDGDIRADRERARIHSDIRFMGIDDDILSENIEGIMFHWEAFFNEEAWQSHMIMNLAYKILVEEAKKNMEVEG